MLPAFLEALAAVLGLLLGSFLNVCIDAPAPRRKHRHPALPLHGVLPHAHRAGTTTSRSLSWLTLRGPLPVTAERTASPWRYPAGRARYVAALVGYVVAFTAWRPSSQRSPAPSRYPSRFLAIAVVNTLALCLAILGFLLIGLASSPTGKPSASRRLHPHRHRHRPSSSSAPRPYFFLGPNENQIVISPANPTLSSPGSFRRSRQRLPHRPRGSSSARASSPSAPRQAHPARSSAEPIYLPRPRPRRPRPRRRQAARHGRRLPRLLPRHPHALPRRRCSPPSTLLILLARRRANAPPASRSAAFLGRRPLLRPLRPQQTHRLVHHPSSELCVRRSSVITRRRNS